MIVFVKIDFFKGELKLLLNVIKIKERQNYLEIVFFVYIVENGSDIEFMVYIL